MPPTPANASAQRGGTRRHRSIATRAKLAGIASSAGWICGATPATAPARTKSSARPARSLHTRRVATSKSNPLQAYGLPLPEKSTSIGDTAARRSAVEAPESLADAPRAASRASNANPPSSESSFRSGYVSSVPSAFARSPAASGNSGGC